MIKKNILLAFSFAAILVACNSGNKANVATKITEAYYIQQIDSMEAILYAHPEAGFNKDAAQKTVNVYANMVKDFPNTKLAAEYLFKAGEISSSLNKSREAIEFFKTVYSKYPNFKKAPYCLFLQAFIYENQLHELGAAQNLYQEVIQKYPDERIAQDAKACIANLGKTDEELIREFEAKNKKSS